MLVMTTETASSPSAWIPEESRPISRTGSSDAAEQQQGLSGVTKQEQEWLWHDQSANTHRMYGPLL